MWFICIVAVLGGVIGTPADICTHTTCTVGRTCCATPSGQEGCCAYANATCCEDGRTCCPSGMECDMVHRICTREHSDIQIYQEDVQVQYPSALKNSTVQMLHNEYCLDGTECPDQSTCCPMASGHYGCCPRPNAVCCSDKLHCCPNGYTCDGEGYCHQIAANENRLEQVEEEEANVLQCSDSSTICGPSETCCVSEDGMWSCCPFQSAVCCSDGQHCCPLGYKCLPGSQSCLKV